MPLLAELSRISWSLADFSWFWPISARKRWKYLTRLRLENWHLSAWRNQACTPNELETSNPKTKKQLKHKSKATFWVGWKVTPGSQWKRLEESFLGDSGHFWATFESLSTPSQKVTFEPSVKHFTTPQKSLQKWFAEWYYSMAWASLHEFYAMTPLKCSMKWPHHLCHQRSDS